jgi:hypothetical protein
MTETITEQPPVDLIVERCNLLTFPEPAVATPSTGISDGGDNAARAIYIFDNPDGRAEYVGTVKPLVPAPSGNGWLDRVTPRAGESFDRYYGAQVNPEPENGKHYRTIGGGISILVRYNDDEHSADRNMDSRAFSLIRSEGENAWTLPGDGVNSLSGWPYIEVSFDSADAADDEQPGTAETDDQVTAVRTAVEDAEAEAEAEVPAVATIEDGPEAPTRGMALKEEDGTVLLDPELVQGQAYLFWQNEGWEHRYSDTWLRVYLGKREDNDAERWLELGSADWDRYASAVRWANNYADTGIATSGRYHWAKASYGRPEADETVTATTWTTALDAERTAFEEFNERTNDIAEDAGWCEEYDRIVTSVGMTGRNMKWDVEVEVEFTFSNTDPSSRVDEFLASHHDLSGLTISNADYKATATITITVEGKDSDAAEDNVDSSELENYLRGQMDYASYISIDDWTIQNTTQADS